MEGFGISPGPIFSLSISFGLEFCIARSKIGVSLPATVVVLLLFVLLGVLGRLEVRELLVADINEELAALRMGVGKARRMR